MNTLKSCCSDTLTPVPLMSLCVHSHILFPVVHLQPTMILMIDFGSSVTEKTCDTERAPYSTEMVAERGMLLPRERIPERTCEQVVDIRVRLAVEQVLELPKNSSQDRNLQGTVEQTLDDLVLEMVKQLVKLPKTDGIQQRIMACIAEIPVPQVVEELVKVSKVFPKDGIQQRFAERTMDTPGVSLAEKIVEGPVSQTQQCVSANVQHDVNTLDVGKRIIQEKINQVTRQVETLIAEKTFEVPELQFTDKVEGINCRDAETEPYEPRGSEDHRDSSCNTLMTWSMSLLCRSCKLHWCEL